MCNSPDLTIADPGSIFLMQQQNKRAIDLVDEHIGQINGYQPYFPTVVLVHRFVTEIVADIRNEGWVVSA